MASGNLLVSSTSNTTVWITNGQTRRHVQPAPSDDWDLCVALCDFNATPLEISNAQLAHIPIVGATNANSNPGYDGSL